MDVVILLLRTLFFYGMIFLVTKTLTKNRKLKLMDLLVSIMISELSVLALDRPSQPLAISFIPIVFLLALHLLLMFVKTKKNKSVKAKVSENKSFGTFKPSFADVELGALEPINTYSPVQNLPLPLILEGKVLDHNLDKLGKTRFWLKNQVQTFGVRRFQEVLYCSIDQNGRIFLDKKNVND